MSRSSIPPAQGVGLMPRIAAWGVDALLTLLLLAAGTLVALTIGYLASFCGMIDLAEAPLTSVLLEPIFSLWLLLLLLGFYGWFWSHKGATPGLKMLGLRIQNRDGSNITFTQTLIRLGTSAFGLGNFLVLFNRQQPRAFQDIWAECEIVVDRR